MDEVFQSPTNGPVTFSALLTLLTDYMHEDEQAKYTICVGTDSQVGAGRVVYATVVMIHRIGKGGRFFYRRESHPQQGTKTIAPRLLTEAVLSLGYMHRIAAYLKALPSSAALEIHLDLGQEGRSREQIAACVGMISGAGFVARIKPDAPAASHLADAFTKAPVATTHQHRLFRKERRIGG